VVGREKGRREAFETGEQGEESGKVECRFSLFSSSSLVVAAHQKVSSTISGRFLAPKALTSPLGTSAMTAFERMQVGGDP
jgi:hypothetical protein